MASPGNSIPDQVVAFIDLGTYSIRLLLVRLNPNGSHTVLAERREPVRLGGDEFLDNHLQYEAMERAALVCERFAEMARGFDARDIVAVATSATREAENQQDFLDLVEQRAGIRLRVISGLEEARLVYLGVSRGTHLNGQSALFIDIGGGSTEMAVGDLTDFQQLESVKAGAIRVAQRFGLDQADPIEKKRYAEVKRQVRSDTIRAVERLNAHPWQLVVASSGTTRNLARVANHLRGNRINSNEDPKLTYAGLLTAADHLRRLPREERRNVTGLNPDRADIIVAGAAIIETLMEAFGIEELQTSRSGVRDGLLMNYLDLSDHDTELYTLSARRRSVMLLGRNCHFDEEHAQHVAKLALAMFDAGRAAQLFAFGESERELLEYAALLHDIGVFLSFVDHHAHTYYLISNADLVGFDQTEIAVIAALSRYHRKGLPRRKHGEVEELDRASFEFVSQLAPIMRIAESLDRSHSGVVTGVRFERPDSHQLVLHVQTAGDATLELWAAARHVKAFQRTYGVQLEVVEERVAAEVVQPAE